MLHGRFPPAGQPPEHTGPKVRARDVFAVAVILAGALGLLAFLFLLNPLVAASAVCLVVIGAGVALGME